MELETLAVHAGHQVDAATGAVAPPIYPSTNYERSAGGGSPDRFYYAIFDNPNRHMLEEAMLHLEGAELACAFSSGSAAAMAVFQALAPRSHVIAPIELFHGTARLLRDHLTNMGISASFVDMGDTAAVAAALRPDTRLIWIETPANPLLGVADIRALCALAASAHVCTAVDNSSMTAAGQRPLEHGADLVVYSTTKFISGHGDVVGGMVLGKRSCGLWPSIRAFQQHIGAVPSPFDCWLLLRSLRTLPHRMRIHCANAARLADYLSAHPAVSRVLYPGLPAHRNHDVAVRQMRLFGGLLSIRVKGGKAAAIATTAATRLFIRASSFGGTESLIEHRASSPIQTMGSGSGQSIPDDLLRLSVGLEHVDDLMADIDQALHRAIA